MNAVRNTLIVIVANGQNRGFIDSIIVVAILVRDFSKWIDVLKG